MEAYKITKTINPSMPKGRIFVSELIDGDLKYILAATPTEGTQLYYAGYTISRLLTEGSIEKIDLRNEKWVHPHLTKSIKVKLAEAMQFA